LAISSSDAEIPSADGTHGPGLRWTKSVPGGRSGTNGGSIRATGRGIEHTSCKIVITDCMQLHYRLLETRNFCMVFDTLENARQPGIEQFPGERETKEIL
jgi:hypothetical protein